MLALSAGLAAQCVPAHANERQYKIEAAFLYSFFNYITWPGYVSPDALKEATICIYGNDPVLEYLHYVRYKVMPERELTVRSVSEGESTRDCHLFFMRHRLSYSLINSLDSSTLTVFKPDDPLDRGGMIELREDGERISIKINKVALEQRGFQTSSRLHQLAQGVR